MRTFVTLMVIASLTLSGCSRLRDSKINPGNWFGKSRSAPVTAPGDAPPPEEVNPLIPERTSIFQRDRTEVYLGTPVDQVTEIRVERLPAGAIIHVTGIALRQGAYDVRLTSKTDDEPVDGVLTFTMAALQPQNQPQGPVSTRRIEVAKFVSNDVLERTRTISIVGARNVQTTRR